jgi:hypothetical protein
LVKEASMRVNWWSTALLCALVGCGGSSKREASEPDETAEAEPGDGDDEESPGESGGEIDPDTIDEITRLFAKRRPAVARCYSEAVQAGKLDKKAKGRLTVEVAIDPGGNAKSVRATQDTLSSPDVSSCVFALIKTWDLPSPKENFAFTFSYDFEPE